jgi:carbon-monoxide dehydrogenase medium subunit/2-furoyl-CoA dehydrogenase FAD binding subunit
MKAASFDYVRAENLAHALSVLSDSGPDAKLIAGGQSLVPMMAMRLARPTLLVDISRISELKHFQHKDNKVSFGACVRQREIEFNQDLNHSLPLLKNAIQWVGHSQTRNRGTIGGSIVFADPSAEIPLVAQVLGASMHLKSTSNEARLVSASDFFLGPMVTAIGDNECLVGIDFPVWTGSRIGSSFTEFSMRKGDFAIASAACQLRLDESGRIGQISFGVGGVNGAPKVFPKLAERIIGKDLNQDFAEDIAMEVLKECDPGSDTHNTAQYKRSLARTLLVRVMLEAVANAKENA